MAIKLHRCSNVWVKVGGHPCWKVQKALDDAGIDYKRSCPDRFARASGMIWSG